MQWNDHSKLKDQHAFLSASNYHWVNYSLDKLKQVYSSRRAKIEGTKLHALAACLIKMNVCLPKKNKTLNMYVNDCIKFKMSPEQTLYYSPNAFGTADAICFRNNKLRIHDYKSGRIPASMKQLMVYAAFFCLEYHKKPSEINIELRIYQNDEIFILEPEPELIQGYMDKLVLFDAQIADWDKEM